jgi:hypothetical protein
MSDSMSMSSRRFFPLALASYLAQVAVQLALASRANGGRFSYAVDDAYIHLALARNLASTGVLGIVPGVHASASSSPAWTLLLAAIAKVVPSSALVFAPLVLNMLLGVALLHRFVARLNVDRTPESPLFEVAIAVALPTFLGLPALTLLGMESTAFALVVFLVVTRAVDPARRFDSRTLALLAIGVLLRPEGLFLALFVALLGVVERRFREAALSITVTVAALIGFGVWNRLHGDELFANSVIAHGTMHHEANETTFAFVRRAFNSYATSVSPVPVGDRTLVTLGVLSAAAFGVQASTRSGPELRVLAAGFFTLATLHQVVCTITAPLDRYQSYLVPIGLLLVARAFAEARPAARRAVQAGLAVLVLGSLHHLWLQARVYRACHEIDVQQGSMAAFVAQAFPTTPIVLNDIGRVSFERPGPLVDVCGLGTTEAMRLAHAGRLDAEAVDRLTRAAGAPLAMVYDRGVPLDQPGACGSRPRSWVLVARWSYPHPTIALGAPAVSIYATDVHEVERVATRVRAFEPHLPPDLRASYP